MEGSTRLVGNSRWRLRVVGRRELGVAPRGNRKVGRMMLKIGQFIDYWGRILLCFIVGMLITAPRNESPSPRVTKTTIDLPSVKLVKVTEDE